MKVPNSNIMMATSNFLEEHLDSSIGRVQNFLRHPSVTADKTHVSECAMFLRDLLAEVGCVDARLIETEGNPIVLGDFNADSPWTLLIYMMYDTQPVNREEWHFDPFGGEIVETDSGDKLLYGRGAQNSKGPLIAFINAVDAILKVNGKLPVNLKIVADGEEEVGSPSFKSFLREGNGDQLKSDAGLAITPGGASVVCLGFKGILVLELECNSEKWGKGPMVGGIHSKFKPVLDSPVWHLVKVLSTLVDQDEDTSLIEGFYNEGYIPASSEIKLIDEISKTVPKRFFTRLGPLPEKLKSSDVRTIAEKLLFEPSINLSSIKAGHIGEQISTIIPHTAKCRMDVRFFGQDGNLLLDKIKRHLKVKGYGDIIVRKVASLPSYRVDIDEPIVKAVLKSVHELGFTPQIWPNSGGGCIVSMIGNSLGIPIVQGGALSGGSSHGADEYITAQTKNEKKAGLLECEKSYVSILYNFPYFASRTTNN